jgi:glycosyltransferase involved in cell wall biosynthesis
LGTRRALPGAAQTAARAAAQMMARRLRVAVVIDTMTWGGAEMLLGDLASALPGVGVDLSVAYLNEFHDSPASVRLREQGLEPVLVPITLLHDPRGFARVRRYLMRLRPDLVHTHLGYADLLAGPAARSLGIPSVSTLHVMEWERGGKEGVKERLMALARRAGARRIVAVSEAGRRAYLERFGERPERVVTIHNGVARAPRPGAGPGVRDALGLGRDDLVLAMVTVLRRGKGHDVAAGAVARLRERFPRLRLLVLGDGPDREEIARTVAPLGDAGVMAGHRDDVMEVLDAVDVVVHPTHADAFPTALLEGMAASVPILATAVGGIPEIVDAGVTGILMEGPPSVSQLAGALEPLLADVRRQREMGAAGRARFEERFSADRWAGRLRALYDEVL